MNLPVNNPIVRNAPLEKIDLNQLFLELLERKFDGYCHLTAIGKYGFEESIIILSKGQITGLIFLISGYDIELYGKEAVLFCFNTYALPSGRVNIFGLTEDQAKLVLLFNDKIKYSLSISEKKLPFKNLNYNEKLLDDLLSKKVAKEKSSKELLNEYNLTDLTKE